MNPDKREIPNEMPDTTKIPEILPGQSPDIPVEEPSEIEPGNIPNEDPGQDVPTEDPGKDVPTEDPGQIK